MQTPFQKVFDMLEEFTDSSALSAAVESGLQSATIVAKAGCQQCFVDGKAPDGTPWPPLTWNRLEGGSDPLRNTGRLMASIVSEASGNELSVQTNRIGAGVHNFGATIVPVNAQWLTIPGTLEAKRVGSPLNFPNQLHPVINSAGTSGVMVDEDDTVQYIMLKKAVIPKREFLGFSPETVDSVCEIVIDRLLTPAKEGGTP